MKNRSLVILAVIFGSAFFLSLPAECSEKLILSTYAGPPLSNTDRTGFCDVIVRTAFSRLGIEVELIDLPAERSITNANQGIVDGDYVRISGLGSIYPNLIQVPEKLLTYEFVAFTRHQPIQPVDWKSLKPYHVGIVRGWKILEEKLTETRQLVRVKNQTLLFKLLDNERVDFTVYSRQEGLWVIKQLQLKGIQELSPPLATRDMFLYLNRKHRSLIPRLSTELKRMKDEGFFMQATKEILNP